MPAVDPLEAYTCGRAIKGSGFVKIYVPDGRRGLWMRVGGADSKGNTLELRAGREGDDSYLRVVLAPEELADARDVLETFRFAKETAQENRRYARERNKAAAKRRRSKEEKCEWKTFRSRRRTS